MTRFPATRPGQGVRRTRAPSCSSRLRRSKLTHCFPHDEIAALVERSPAGCRKLLERARRRVADGRRMITASREEHARLLGAFVRAAQGGDVAGLTELLAADAVLITDGGPDGRRYGRFRNLRAPLAGAARVAAFVAATTRAAGLAFAPREPNGQPAIVFTEGGRTVAALLLGVEGGKIARVFFHADPGRLRFVGTTPS
jgi:RNA polymerase sigma-70 factor (ECF subfamily)